MLGRGVFAHDGDLGVVMLHPKAGHDFQENLTNHFVLAFYALDVRVSSRSDKCGRIRIQYTPVM